MKSKTILYVVGFLALLVILFSWSYIFPPKPAAPVATIPDPSALPGLQTATAPWQPEMANLATRLRAIGLPALPAEAFALHIHQHLDIFIDGNPVDVPPQIGIASYFISPIHVHDDLHVIHVESPTVQTFTLGQFFDIWGVRLTANCIGGYCTDATHKLQVYSNGTLYSGDPRMLALDAHEEIAIVYGTSAEAPKSIPSSYAFPEGE